MPAKFAVGRRCSWALAFLVLMPAGAAAQSGTGRARQPVVADRRLRACRSSASSASARSASASSPSSRRRASSGLMMGVLVPVDSRSATSSPAGRRASSSTMPLDTALRRGRRRAAGRRRRRDVRAASSRPIRATLDAASGCTVESRWPSKNTDASATSRRRPSRPARSPSEEDDASGSSACRSISPAICTTTSASSTTACCCRGRCRKGRRSIRRPSGSRCTSRIIRSTYGEFEGVIPEGYGAGIVMLWDRGTWTPESRRCRRGAEEGRPEVHARTATS